MSNLAKMLSIVLFALNATTAHAADERPKTAAALKGACTSRDPTRLADCDAIIQAALVDESRADDCAPIGATPAQLRQVIVRHLQTKRGDPAADAVEVAKFAIYDAFCEIHN